MAGPSGPQEVETPPSCLTSDVTSVREFGPRRVNKASSHRPGRAHRCTVSDPSRPRQSTSTSTFGVGRREGHDSSAFYDRFPVPEISSDDGVEPPAVVDRLWSGDARDMDGCGEVKDNSVALVVTSPPYFAGKEYEQAVGHGHVPGSYLDYLKMLEDVFEQCVRKLEPGGRIAVNVANLGRRPYRSLSADVIDILQNRLRLLLRGEVIWRKGRGSAGNFAWGSFQRPGNPVLRDVTERVVIASKGRFDRALTAAERHEERLPSEGTAHVDEFMEATTDVWEIPPASAKRVGHPAPFPVELPKRLIELYTYRCDLILDPFMGAGTTAVAAVRTGRHYVGFDTDASYRVIAERRVAEERQRLLERSDVLDWPVTVPPKAKRNQQQRFSIEAGDAPASQDGGPPTADSEATAGPVDFQARAGQDGRKAQKMAEATLLQCGFEPIREKRRFACGVEVNFEARDQKGGIWRFDVSGAFSVTQRPGLRRTDTLWKALGKAAVLHSYDPGTPLVLLTTNRPAPNSAGYRALKALTGPDQPIRAVIEMLSPEDLEHLAELASGDL